MIYRVTRFCCTSGMCIECRAFLSRSKARKRVVQYEGQSKDMAERTLKGWGGGREPYGAKLEEVEA